MQISTTGNYFAVVTQSGSNYNTRVYNIISDGEFVEITRSGSAPFDVSTDETNILFSDDETTISIYDTTVRTYSLTTPADAPIILSEVSFPFPIFTVSKDLNIFVKYHTGTGIIKIYNADGTQSGLKLNQIGCRQGHDNIKKMVVSLL